MDITQVKIFPVDEEKLKAFVSVVFDHCFMVNDIKVIQGKEGLFLSMPSRRKKNCEFKDVAHPLNNETRRLLEECVLEEYRRLANDATPRRPDRQEEQVAAAPTRPEAPVPAAPSARPEPQQTPVAASAERVAASADQPVGDQTLEEVQELHLRDSFWSVT